MLFEAKITISKPKYIGIINLYLCCNNILVFSEFFTHRTYVVENHDALVTIIVMLKFTQLLGPNTYPCHVCMYVA